MKTTFEMCMVDKFKMRITDTTDLDSYLPESQDYSRTTRYKYKDTCTVDIITYKNEVFDSFITTHEGALNEVYYTLPIDGNYTIHHLIMPTKEWVDYIKENQRDYFNNYDVIYYTDNNKIYKYTRILVKDSSLPNLPYYTKTLKSLDTDTNWYYIKQHSYFHEESGYHPVIYDYSWYQSVNSDFIHFSKESELYGIDDKYKQWCFVKNGNNIDIYNRATKQKVIYKPNTSKPYLGNDPLFIGWNYHKITSVGDKMNTNYNTNNTFRLSRIIENNRKFINLNVTDSQKTLSYWQPDPEVYDNGSDIRAVQVADQRYGNEYIEIIEEADLIELINSEKEISVVKAQQDTFSICYLNNCFLNICQNIYNSMSFGKCIKQNKDLVFNRDLLWMIINVIKYNLDLGYPLEAQRVLDEFNSCGNNICSNSINSNYGCGCS